jgi:hypothetical protein
MAGPDLDSGGFESIPSTVVRPKKRKRGEAATEDRAPPRRATRNTAGLDMDGAVQWTWSAAAGALWAVPRRNRGLDVKEERMGPVILEVHLARSELKPDDSESPYAKVSTLGPFEFLGHLVIAVWYVSRFIENQKCLDLI